MSVEGVVKPISACHFIINFEMLRKVTCLAEITIQTQTASVATLIDSRTSFTSWYIFLALEPSKNKITII
jgi:hypothetical protein